MTMKSKSISLKKLSDHRLDKGVIITPLLTIEKEFISAMMLLFVNANLVECRPPIAMVNNLRLNSVAK